MVGNEIAVCLGGIPVSETQLKRRVLLNIPLLRSLTVLPDYPSTIMEQKSAVTPASPNEDECHILRLPNELLGKVLQDSLFPFVHPVFLPLTHLESIDAIAPARRRLIYSELSKLRSVCRTFRYIVNESSEWLRGTYDLCWLPGHLVAYYYLSATEIKDRYNSFLETLLSDNQLRNTLQRRTEWFFENLFSFEATCEHVPDLLQNITHLTFHSCQFLVPDEWIESDREMWEKPFFTLSQSVNLKNLSIIEIDSPVSLTSIGAHLPQLESLEIKIRRDDRGTPLGESYEGSLDDYKNLINLSYFEDPSPDFSRFDPITSGLLPFASVHSLTFLSLRFGERGSNSDEIQKFPFCLDGLNQFVNLKNLQLEPLDATVCNILATIESFRLESFATAISKGHRSLNHDVVATLLSSSGLRKLREFDFYVHTSFMHEGLLPLIGRTLPELEILKINIQLDVGWAGAFSRLRKLRYVEWTAAADIDMFDFEDLVTDSFCDVVRYGIYGQTSWDVDGWLYVKFAENHGLTKMNLKVTSVGLGDSDDGSEQDHTDEEEDDDYYYDDDYGSGDSDDDPDIDYFAMIHWCR